VLTQDRLREIQELVDVTSWGDWASASEPFENVAAGASAISTFLMRSAKANDSGDVYAVVSVERERRGRNPDLLEALQIGQPEDLVLVAVCGFGEHGKNNAVFISQARRAMLDLLADNAELRRKLSEQAAQEEPSENT